MPTLAVRCLVCALFVAAFACGGERNGAPTAELSAELVEATVGDEITVDGSDSSDPDGDPLLFRWSVDGPDESSVDLSGSRSETVSFSPDVAGTYTIGLTVDDGEFESAAKRVDIEVSEGAKPQADAGPDQSVPVGEEVTLDGTQSVDPGDGGLAYQWSFEETPQTSQAALSDPNHPSPTFVPDVAGDYVVSLVVSANAQQSEPDTVVVSAAVDDTEPPVADAGADQDVLVHSEVVLDGSASHDPDPDNSELNYQWSFVEAPGASEPDIEQAQEETAGFVPVEAGQYTVELAVTDGAGNTATDTVEVIVRCFIISEYIEGSGFNKAVELYNCSPEPLDLSEYGMCVVSNDNTTCTTYDFGLTGTLAPEGVETVCHDDIADPAPCNVLDASVNFAGDDRIALYRDVDASESFSSSDLVVDAFGELENRPSQATIWQDVTLRRCNFEPFDGQSGFNYTEFFDEAAQDDFSDFGIAPVEGCAN